MVDPFYAQAYGRLSRQKKVELFGKIARVH